MSEEGLRPDERQTVPAGDRRQMSEEGLRPDERKTRFRVLTYNIHHPRAEVPFRYQPLPGG